MLRKIRSRLGRGEPTSPVQKVILSRQGDGLGERLNALLNAIRLSDLLGIDFRFTWPTGLAKDAHHAIVPPEEFFTTDFVAAHMIDHTGTKEGFPRLSGQPEDLGSLREQLDASEQGLQVSNRPLTIRDNPDAVAEGPHGFAAEFAQVDFHPTVVDAISAARAPSLGSLPVGIHLRAGDNLFGRYRSWTRYAYKVVPVPVARALIERYRDEGREVLIFGQDDQLIAELCETTGAIDASTLRPSDDMSRPAEAMFDLVLLSRCDRIISGFSGFAIQAASISGKSVDNHLDLITPSEVVTLTRKDLAAHGEHYSPTHRSFAWWSAYWGARDELDYDDAVPMLEAALEADPTNPRSRLRLAAIHYRNGHDDRGDRVLVDALVDDVEFGGKTLPSVLLFSLLTVGGYDSLEIFDDVERRANDGAGPATIYWAALEARRGDGEAAQQHASEFLSFAAGDHRLADLEGLADLATASIERQLKHVGRPG